MEIKRKFISGVVEGFYGRPWTLSQRKELFLRSKQMGLNTYLYAPKDDLKHRQMWRELYTKKEAMQLKSLIEASRLYGITFVYAISPGLDITFSDVSDIFLLKQKMNQVLNLGCNAFSLLFDDIDPNLNNSDKNVFHSLAHAQATLTNDIYELLNKPPFFLFCPTEYCATRSIPTVSKSEYLSTIGDILCQKIDIMWTGPKVISKNISLESILKLSNVLKRPPVLWDNIHANDYDQRRVFLGPFCGRSSKLLANIRGVLLNPNNEFEANFIAIHTLGQWAKFHRLSDSCDMINTDSCSDSDDSYNPSKALQLALNDWLKLLYKKENIEEEGDDEQSSNERIITINSDPLPLQTGCVSEIKSHVFNRQKSAEIINLPNKSNDERDSNRPLSDSFLSQYINIENEKANFQTNQSTHEKLSSGGVSINLTKKLSEKETHNIDSVDHKNETCNDYKNFYESSNENHSIYPEMELIPKTEYITVSQANHDQMILDNLLNTFPLTPMETEDNQAETDNLTDCMAMQVDNVYENACENMDIIEDMENNSNTHKRKTQTGIRSDKIEDSETIIDESKLTLDDLNLLVNMFFLPYEHGPYAIKILKLIQWLRSHSFYINRKNKNLYGGIYAQSALQKNNIIGDIDESFENRCKIYEWQSKAKEFINEVERFRNMVDRFFAIPNRSILYDLYPYLQEMRHVLQILHSYVKWMGCSPGYNESLMYDDHEPWVFKGGLLSELQRMFPLDGSNDFFPNKITFVENPSQFSLSNSNNDFEIKIETKDDINCQYSNDLQITEKRHVIYMLQTYHSESRQQLNNLCFDLFYNQLRKNTNVKKKDLIELKLDKFRNLPGDRYLGIFLEFCSNTCMVLEDSNGTICGYALGTTKVDDFLKFRKAYNLRMKKKYETHRSNTIAQGIVSSDVDNSPQKDIESLKLNQTSIVERLIDGFRDHNLDTNLSTIYNTPLALIHINMTDVCRETDVNIDDSLGYKLIKCICSRLKSDMNQHDDLTYESVLNHYDQGSSNLLESTFESCETFKPNLDRVEHSSLPLTLFCEVDDLNKNLKKFYKKYGFDMCNLDGDFSSVFLMSRYI